MEFMVGWKGPIRMALLLMEMEEATFLAEIGLKYILCCVYSV